MSSKFKVLGAIIALLGPVLSACAAAPSAASAPAASTVGADYIIGPGDTLQVFVHQNPDLSITLPVRSDGKITTPLVEDMVAVGKTTTKLARDIEAVLAELVRSPQVNVLVTQSANHNYQVKVMGQVEKPQAVAYREGMTVLDALLDVGGLSQFAAGHRAKVIRTEGGKQTELPVNLRKLLNDGVTQNHKLRPGDILLVPESRF